MNERNFAIETLIKVFRGGFASELLLEVNNNLNKQLIRQLVYGVIENNVFLEYTIRHSLLKPDKKLKEEVSTILKVGIYQKFFMNNIPDYAIVNESLKSCEYFHVSNMKGLVNSILRNIEKDEIDNSISKMPSVNDRLKTTYSVSEDFYDLLLKNYKIKTIRKILDSFLNPPEFIIRVNEIVTNIEILKQELMKLDIYFKDHPFLGNALIIDNPYNIFETEIFQKGFFTIQGGGSILSSISLNPKQDSNILDICAAPGGKTCHLCDLIENKGNILANDIHKNKLSKIKENASRLKCKNISYSSFDATVFQKDIVNSFDYILLDAPCSGSGVVSKNPEIKLRRNKEEIRKLIKTQRMIMENSIKYLKIGGHILYSTCSIFKEENEEQREYFLDRFNNIKTEEFEYRGKLVPYLSLMPYEEGTDGFFISKFKKISN
ncbi:MAG: 16S rRNA (cytosine(967)-C(5))-methyltransferase RsmB [Lagierella massiliensis]|nr:16S rRNA (cytosine(967)-C(5))-methyltransferase RsmB [Lagierella massiliensis]